MLLTIPNQLGVDFNLKMLEAIVKEIKPALTTKGGLDPVMTCP